MTDSEWSQMIGELAADALYRAKLVQEADIPKVTAIVAEETLVRLALGDRPRNRA